LARIANDDHPRISVSKGDVVIFSSRKIPGNEVSISTLQNKLVRIGVEIITDKDAFIHVSGHPARDEMMEMYQTIKPEISIPLHGELRHLIEHAALAKTCHVKQAVITENGGMIRLAPGPAEIIDNVHSGRLALEGGRLVKLDSELIRGRTRALWNGTATVTVVVDKVGHLLGDVQISTIGLLESDDFDFEDRFLDVLPLLITTAEQEGKFFDLIDRQIEAEKDKSYSDYSIVQLLKSKIDYLQRTKREKEVLALIETNKNYPDFREILVSQAISEKDFSTAKELCQEGITIAKTERHWGTENNWHIKLLEIAEKQEDILEIRQLCEKLYFNSHYSMDYHLKLRSTYAKNEWPDRCEEIINKLKGKNQRGGHSEVNALAHIFIEEKYMDRLLKLSQINSKDVFFVDTYANHLQNQFPTEILVLYEEGVKEFAQGTGRNIYNDVAKLLKKMKKIKGGKENVTMLIRYFRNLYKNRRAMMEVLSINFPETIPSLKGKEVQKAINTDLRLL